MLLLVTKATMNRRLALGAVALALTQLYFFGSGGWFGRRAIYPPTTIDTNNRLFPSYIATQGELHDLLLFKEPLILNFTIMADPRANKLTQALYDILGSASIYPLDSKKHPCNMVSISSDTDGGREMMLTYGVNKIPSVVSLHKQIPNGRYVMKGDKVDHEGLRQWIAQQCK